MPPPPEVSARHVRQLRLPDLGAEGQARLKRARVLIVGCGGLGTPLVSYLAGAGVGHLTLVDDDVVEVSNLNRQTLHRTADLGRRKVDRAAEMVRDLDPGVSVEARAERVTTHNARALVRAHDLTVDGSDGLPTKFLLNDASVRESRPLVHGAVTGWSGQLLVVKAGGQPCLRCLFEALPAPGTVPTCQEAGVLGAAVGVVGSLMALAALRELAGLPSIEGFLSLDLATASTRRLTLPSSPECPTCGPEWEIDAENPSDYEPEAC